MESNSQTQSYISNLPYYDHIFSTKQALQHRLKQAGAPSSSWLPFAYDPELHHPVQSKPELMLSLLEQGLIGSAKCHCRTTWVQRRIHGNSWNGMKIPGWEQQPAVTGEKYCEAISGAKSLGLLRVANDQSTDRSYEIGPLVVAAFIKTQTNIEPNERIPR